MKKIIALAVASAFVVPVYAAEVTISGDQNFGYTDANGTTSTDLDGDFNVKATSEASNGITAAADFNISDGGSSDGGMSVTVSGPFGKIDMGDTSSATDSVDARGNVSYFIGPAVSSGGDAAIGWSLPTLVPNVGIYVSHSADSNSVDSGQNAHTGFALTYDFGMGEVAYATNEADDSTNNTTYVGASVKMSGLTVTIDSEETGDSGSTTESQALGLAYSFGDVTVNYVTQQDEDSDGTKTAEVSYIGASYALGGGLTAFAENSSDDVNADLDKVAVGVAYKF